MSFLSRPFLSRRLYCSAAAYTGSIIRNLPVVFCLLWSSSLFAAEPFRFAENNKKQLTLTEGLLPVLTYQFGTIEHENVPKTDKRRTAGCYIHPLHGINGEILTDNAPKDHYHHHGIFWTWPHVSTHEPDGKTTEYDLWTSNTELKQHFVRWIEKTVSEEKAVFAVENGWFIGKPEDGKKIMTEQVKVIVRRRQTEPDGFTSRAVDFELTWQPVDKPVTLRGSEGKSYGGFSIRFKPATAVPPDERPPITLTGKKGVNRITTPTGIAEKDLPETPLAWADYTSLFDDKKSGAAIFVPKNHPDYPPTWLTRYYGPLCVGYPGVKGKTFQPDEKLELRYRVWIHRSNVTLPQIENAYEQYNGK
ncbi:MAG: PmoA family protein [Planctomycetaceae bacterium]|nr:PmoA family protein [Planctomycetaceae bacterium]